MISRRILLGFGASATFVVRDATPARAAIPPALPYPGAVTGLMPGIQPGIQPGVQPGRASQHGLARHAPRPPAGKGAKPIVFLDPGHGGKDPGAIGVSGTYEKHVALAAARELQRRLEAGGRYQARLSRGGDVFIPLEQRVALAQAHGADLFVSMHADALADHAVRGASVYTLSDHASDAQTAALATRENAADRFAGPGFHGVSPEVQQILASLVRHETRTRSALLARDVVGALGQGVGGHGVGLLENPARHAGFVVLKAPDIPSVLVEMGFMSNPEDEAALQLPAHRALVAEALHGAIDRFFAVAPPAADAVRISG